MSPCSRRQWLIQRSPSTVDLDSLSTDIPVLPRLLDILLALLRNSDTLALGLMVC